LHAKLVDTYLRTVEMTAFEARLTKLEERASNPDGNNQGA
jgi:hypothetical protein